MLVKFWLGKRGVIVRRKEDLSLVVEAYKGTIERLKGKNRLMREALKMIVQLSGPVQEPGLTQPAAVIARDTLEKVEQYTHVTGTVSPEE